MSGEAAVVDQADERAAELDAEQLLARQFADWRCPGCGQPDFRLIKRPAAGSHLFELRCANCRRHAGTGFPC